MKKIAKILIKIVVILIVYGMINVPIAKASIVDKTIEDAGNFINTGRIEANSNSSINGTNLKSTTSDIYNALLIVGIAASVIIGGILGIQIMWGSIEQQVKAKEMLLPYAAGCVVIFGAFGIWKICVTIFSQL